MPRWTRAVSILLVAAVACVATGRAVQAVAQAPASPSFEVAVVKRTAPKRVVPFQIRPGGHVVATSVTLRDLILRAYGVRPWNLVGAPEWTTQERFDIEATFQEPATVNQVNAMLRTLLEKRFRLVTRTERRDMTTDVMVLTTAGRPGPRLHPVRVDCETKLLLEGSGPGLFPPEQRPICGMVVIARTISSAGTVAPQTSNDTLVAFTMDKLADFVAGRRGRQAYDRTGLTGQFDIDLSYVSDQDAVLIANAGRTIDGPPFDVALREQLGINLQQERNQVEHLVVTSVELPRAEEN